MSMTLSYNAEYLGLKYRAEITLLVIKECISDVSIIFYLTFLANEVGLILEKYIVLNSPSRSICMYPHE